MAYKKPVSKPKTKVTGPLGTMTTYGKPAQVKPPANMRFYGEPVKPVQITDMKYATPPITAYSGMGYGV